MNDEPYEVEFEFKMELIYIVEQHFGGAWNPLYQVQTEQKHFRAMYDYVMHSHRGEESWTRIRRCKGYWDHKGTKFVFNGRTYDTSGP